MKLLHFNDFELGVLKGDQVVNISSVVADIPHFTAQDRIAGLIEHFEDYRGKIEAYTAANDGELVSSVRVRSPIPKPVNIDCMAVNYMEDGTRDAPAPINAFFKSSNCVIGDGDTMILDDIPAKVFEGEAELAVVIGKHADHVSEADAMDYVFGYMGFIDGSARDLPPAGNAFYQMKARKTFAPMGPYLVTKDEIADPHKLQVQLWNNGTLYQNFNTDDMAHNIPKCISWVSAVHPLEPGDVLATGTNHRGLNPFMDGDKIELEIEHLGRLAVHVKDDLKRTWARITRLEHAESGGEGRHTPQLTGKYAP
ncbi:MAG: fumarylacetoacetate hydrolase family protein [Rhodospirillaceae bacterium]|jgi:2-keto-4-pentenoate hydratase/2-oxohepta-3-ene-1,7-dioic acid hydratase in catechol pathway